MPGGAVGLHNEMLLGPTEVGNDPTTGENERLVDVRGSQAATDHEIEHEVLELTSGRGWTGGDDSSKVASSTAWTQSSENVRELANVDALQRLRLANGATKPVVFKDRSEIQQRPGRRCDRNPFVTGDIRPSSSHVR